MCAYAHLLLNLQLTLHLPDRSNFEYDLEIFLKHFNYNKIMLVYFCLITLKLFIQNLKCGF